MINKIVIMPDSFKNTMTSEEVCDIIVNKLNEKGISVPTKSYPIADGGEGTALIFSKYLNLQIKKMKTTNAFNKEIEIEYGSDGEVAVIDIASVVGFFANDKENLNPQIATTYGIGRVIKEIISFGHKKIYIGLGGSITNDLGLGMMSELGVKFYDETEKSFMPTGGTLKSVKKIDVSELIKFEGVMVCLSDVKSPLLGETGAALMFSKQKGATEEMVLELEEDTKTFLNVARRDIGSYEDYQGSGAAGGLGYAFKAFFNAEMVSGINEVIKISNVSYNIDEHTMVITGEGSFDQQSLEGKVISGIVDIVKKKKAKMIVVAGVIDENIELDIIEKTFACSQKGRKLEDIKKTCRADLVKATEKIHEYLVAEYNIK